MTSNHPGEIIAASAAIRAGVLTASELVSHSLDRVKLVEPRINAFITIDREGALERAAALDGAQERGETLGILHGIPVAVKDNFATAKLPTTLGSAIARSWVAGYDATCVRRLQDAGAILLGKTNLHEFALGATNINPHFGSVRNPWDESRISGGSSGGSAAAVAAGEVYASLGSDAGGSVRMPASLCGVVGLKPTYGRVSLRGLVGGVWSIDHVGPLTATVSDAALVYEAIAGYDPGDLNSSRVPVDPVIPHLDEDVVGVRVGAVLDDSMGWVHPDVAKCVRSAAEALAQAGVEVEEVSLPGFEGASFATLAIAYAEVSSQHRTWIRQRASEYGNDTRMCIWLGELLSASQYLLAQRARNAFHRQLMAVLGRYDALMLPTAAVTATRLDGQLDSASVDDPEARFALMRFTVAFNLTGLPAISVPCGLDGRGLPIGAQFVGYPFREVDLLRIARAYERTRDRSRRWALPSV